MEMLDVYTHDGERTGKLVERGRRYRLGDDEYTMVIHAFIYHRDHGFLIQKRSATKRVLPGAWCMTMGVVQAGEDSETGMRREVREELGLEIADGQIRNCVRTYNGHKIVDIYLVCEPLASSSRFTIIIRKTVMNYNCFFQNICRRR